MHHIHRTKAFVLKNIPIREADSHVVLFAEKFGLIYAVALGARKMESKMRQSIQNFSLLEAALVAGRSGWRLVNAKFVNNFYSDIKNEPLKKSLCKIFNLIARLVVDETEDHRIFGETLSLVNWALENQDKISRETDILSFETIFLSRILNLLGYLSVDEDTKLVLNNPIGLDLINKLTDAADSLRKRIINEINRAVRDSHL
ncbi:MAG TPA: DNA repair protein RecO [Candidatus Paceibacterota bacterium]|nr:DNA repair protein RecO [Candidatus Paceibacterota bacterium]HRZ34179.1 DNA repair protein RecO [Candidatus Paceibacterota bacterium]